MPSVEALRKEKGKEALGAVVKIFGRLVLISELKPDGFGGYPLTDEKGATINTSFKVPNYLALQSSMLIEVPTEQKELLELHKKPTIFILQKYHGQEDGKWARDMLEVLRPKFYDPEGGLALKTGRVEELTGFLLDLAKDKGLEGLDKLTPANFTVHRIIAKWEPLMIGERLIVQGGDPNNHEGSLYLNSFGGEVFKWEKELNGWVRLKDAEDLWKYIEPYLKGKITALK